MSVFLENGIFSIRRSWTEILSWLLILLGAFVLIGWEFDISLLKRPLTKLVAMNPLTATCFILSGISLVLRANRDRKSRKSNYASGLIATLVVSICMAQLLSLSLNGSLHFDMVLYSNKLLAESTDHVSNRMAINTSLSFIMMGVAIICSLSGEHMLKLISNFFALFIVLLALFSILGYTYQVPEFTAILARIPMAPHTATGLAVGAYTILRINAHDNFMSVINSKLSGGIMARYLIPAAVIVPVIGGLIRLNAAWSKSISIELGTALLITFSTIVFFTLILIVSNQINQNEEKQAEAETMFKNLLETAPDGIVIVDSNGTILLTNNQTERIFGYTKAELTGKKIETLLPERYRKEHESLKSNYIRNPRVREMGAGIDLYAMKKDGQEFPVEISLSPLETKKGKVISAAIRDVTVRKKSEKKFRDLLESAPDAIVIVNTGGTIQLVNKQTEKIFGYDRHELIGKPIEILIPARFHSGHPGHRNRFFENPQTRSMGTGLELKALRKNGDEFPVEISLSPLETEGGFLVSSAIRDVSDRKESEKKINQLAAIVETSEDAIVSKSLEGRIISWNAGAEKLFGYTSEEIIGQHISILIPEERHDEEFRILNSVSHGKVIKHFETIRKHKKGHDLHVSITVSPIHDKSGRVIGASKIARDISEKIRQEDELAKALNNFRDLYNNSPCGYFSIDQTITFSRINDTLLTWLGYSREEVVNKMKFEDFLSKHSREEYLENFIKASQKYKEHGYANGLEFDFVKKDGSILPVVVNSIWLYDEHGEFISSRSTVFDNTEQKKAEEEILTLNKELESFSYSVSHDMRAPLRSIVGYTQILEEDYYDKLDDEGKKIIQTITRNTTRMGQLIDDMLTLSRARRSDMTYATMDMQEMVTTIISELSAFEKERKINFNIQEVHSAKGDVNLIRQVWTNLISNAIKYTNKKEVANIEISSMKSNKGIYYKIKDDGAGFDSSYAHKLFGVFQRLHKANEFEGTGVGLAIVKRIIERHKGQVWAEGTVGQGATFYFSLPN